MRKWVNIMISNSVSLARLRAVAQEAGPVPIGPDPDLGSTLRYELRDDCDLYAEVEVVEAMHKYHRAVAVCSVGSGGALRLIGVLFTTLPRDLVRGMSSGLWE